MLFSALAACTAVWMMVSPYLGLESGLRATAIVAAGIAALILAPLRMTSPTARWSTAALGLALGLLNFGPTAPLASLANLGTCAVLLIIGGIAPEPVAIPARVAEEVTAKTMAPASAPGPGVRLPAGRRLGGAMA
ncbi:MAG TPA: hypothetical protein VIU64_13205 [Polyangia bacterium]